MKREYIFEFAGSREHFLHMLNRTAKHNYTSGTYYYFDDYIVKIIDDEIHFGVARGGHSGGYWFIPTVTELDNRIEFRGTIQYIGPEDNRGPVKKIFDGIGDVSLYILLFPMCLIFWLYTLAEKTIRKIFNRPKPKEKTLEERLFDLMENYFYCSKIK